jgi:DNA-binding NtrC family response regulator
MRAELVDVSLGVVRALEQRRAAALANEYPIHWLLESASMATLAESARRIARTATTPILIQGERGCGVQELGRLVHDDDAAARGRRFKVVPARLVGPAEMRGGVQAGTLFIEDIENLKPTGQQWLTEVLADRETGANALRIIGSSRFAVRELLQQRSLNQELIHALDVARLVIPPLRERPAEILPLARKMSAHYAARSGQPSLRLSVEAERKLSTYSYPANVCELRNIIERAVALSGIDDQEVGDGAIVFYDQPAAGRNVTEATRASPKRGAPRSQLPSMVEMERDYLVMLIRELRGRRTEISRAMGVSYPTVLKKIALHGLDVRAIVASNLEERVGG